MMKRHAAILLALAGCAPAHPATPGALTGSCKAETLAALIGKPADAALIARAKRLSGAGTARTLRPGQAVTMEYRQDRLNILIDDTGKVTRFTCG